MIDSWGFTFWRDGAELNTEHCQTTNMELKTISAKGSILYLWVGLLSLTWKKPLFNAFTNNICSENLGKCLRKLPKSDHIRYSKWRDLRLTSFEKNKQSDRRFIWNFLNFFRWVFSQDWQRPIQNPVKHLGWCALQKYFCFSQNTLS